MSQHRHDSDDPPPGKRPSALESHADTPADDRYPRFAAAGIEKMRRFGSIEHWRAGDVMFRIGQPGFGMRVLLSGRARLSRRDGLGRSQTIVELGAGQFLGEVAQLTGKPALADGLALDDVEALMIPPEQIREMLVAQAHLAAGVRADTACFALQTSVPGVFAIGDVRNASAKRVAAAVGDGAAVVAEIHQFLSAATPVA